MVARCVRTVEGAMPSRDHLIGIALRIGACDLDLAGAEAFIRRHRHRTIP